MKGVTFSQHRNAISESTILVLFSKYHY